MCSPACHFERGERWCGETLVFGSLITREWRWQRQRLMDLALTWQLPFAWLPSCCLSPPPPCTLPAPLALLLHLLAFSAIAHQRIWQNVQLLPLPANLTDCAWCVLACHQGGGGGRIWVVGGEAMACKSLALANCKSC